jgi:ubiquinone/menaquinone biosynthesis C-methylase UbiE
VTSADIRGAYDLSADAWAGGPERLYGKLAEALLAAAPVDIHGARVLDVGAGTGVASRAALAAGATSVVAVDLSASMLGEGRGAFDPVLADAGALPFRAAAFDLVVAACCLSHLPDPRQALRETRRVGSAIVASTFTADWTHPAKPATEDALAAVGFQAPAWYVTFKATTERLIADPAVLAALADSAGYSSVQVTIVEVASGLDTPAELVAWRLGMAHVAPFLRSLPPERQAQVRRTAEDALVGAPPLVVPIVILAAG